MLTLNKYLEQYIQKMIKKVGYGKIKIKIKIKNKIKVIVIIVYKYVRSSPSMRHPIVSVMRYTDVTEVGSTKRSCGGNKKWKKIEKKGQRKN